MWRRGLSGAATGPLARFPARDRCRAIDFAGKDGMAGPTGHIGCHDHPVSDAATRQSAGVAVVGPWDAATHHVDFCGRREADPGGSTTKPGERSRPHARVLLVRQTIQANEFGFIEFGIASFPRVGRKE
jgi:hypothetical protein